MISLDQVLLLQKKVETAVEKIRSLNAEVLQLKSDNDALRRTCAELKNSLADKSGSVSSMEETNHDLSASEVLSSAHVLRKASLPDSS